MNEFHHRMAVRSVAVVAAAAALVGSGPGRAAATARRDPLCSGNYVHGRVQAARTLRFGIDPEPAGNAGSSQSQVKPVSLAKTLRALRALRPPGKELVLRVNRLFEADGEAGIRRFQRTIDGYTRAGFDTELQVRYHPTVAEAGNIAAWERYVRHVVDVFGPDRHLVAMTITNEINVPISPNTSDGGYPRAEAALVQGIIAAHREAIRRGFTQLRFGFTYAYRFNAQGDAAMFTGLRRGGAAFRRALGFVGVDYYPELYPGLTSGISIPEATEQMMATVRRCLVPLGGLGPRIPIWITESGFDTTPGKITGARQRTALRQIVGTIRASAATFGVTDFRWFNLRDNVSTAAGFAETSGLLTDSYRHKPALAAYRSLIARYGAAEPSHKCELGFTCIG